MLRQAADQGYKLNLMTGDSIATSEFWQISGPAGEGTLFTFPTDPRRSPTAANALEQFKAQGFDPEGFTLFSYGVIQAIADGIKKAGSDDPKAVAKALEERRAGRDRDGPGQVRRQGRHQGPALRHQHVDGRQVRADRPVGGGALRLPAAALLYPEPAPGSSRNTSRSGRDVGATSRNRPRPRRAGPFEPSRLRYCEKFAPARCALRKSHRRDRPPAPWR